MRKLINFRILALASDHQMTNRQLPSNRSFGLTFTFVFSAASIWLWWKGVSGYGYCALAALGILATTLVIPEKLSPLNALWARLGELLHSLTSPIVTGIIYFLVLTPMGICMRLIGRDPLKRKPSSNETTYWIERPEHEKSSTGFDRQF